LDHLVSIQFVGLRDFPRIDDVDEYSSGPARGRTRQPDHTTESIFILPALELHFQTRQQNGLLCIHFSKHSR
jgi:hypothetical protein